MPTVTMIAGPNGSGKSTLLHQLVDQGVDFGEYLNADDIARELTGLPETIAAMAQQIVRDRRSAAVAARQSHAFETVMSHPSHIEHMRGARQCGFETRLIFVCTDDVAINVGRVANRVVHGGHDVPLGRIVDRYGRCLDLLPAAIDAADAALVFDNSARDRPLRLIATIKAGILRHGEVQASPLHLEERAPNDLPNWWRLTLQRIKPTAPFKDGPLA